MLSIFGSMMAKLTLCFLEWKSPTITFDLILDFLFMFIIPYPTYLMLAEEWNSETYDKLEIFVGLLLSLMILRVFQCLIAYR